MSGGYIPKERLTAYERWEVAAFDEAERMAQAMREAAAAAPGDPEPVAPPEPPPAEPPISPEELAALREQAQAEGRAAGYEAGFAAGQADGLASGAEAIRAETAIIAALARNFDQALEGSESEIADDLLALALDIAAQILRTSLKVKPELVLPAVRDAIAALVNPHGHPTIALNPADAAIVRTQLDDQLAHSGWRIIDDPQIGRGGCRIENGGAEVDATLPTRWHRIVNTLGKQSDWLDEQ